MSIYDSPLAQLAHRFQSDKGFSVLNAHGYTRVYEAILNPVRQQPLRLLEVGLLHPALHGQPKPFAHAPSLQMWLEYLPQAQVMGMDIEDFSGFAHARCRIVQADESNPASLEQAAQQLGGQFDIIIDDASHASHHQQIGLGVLFQHLRPGGIYVVEDMHYQPAPLEQAGIAKTRDVLSALARQTPYPAGRTALSAGQWQVLQQQIEALNFFDSLDAHRSNPADCADALAVIKKRA
jgi:SAM-dependent methyltransferase